MNKNKNKKIDRNSIINAVALQDHISRSLLLPKYSINKNKTKITHKNSLNSAGRSIIEDIRWSCDECTYLNPKNAKKCEICGSIKPNYNDIEENEDDDPVLTLAQKRGLVNGPDKLTKEQWENVFRNTIKRKDHEQPCPICQEYYTTTPQVILSCGHLFHLNCLTSFEKFVSIEKRVCPICRKKNYQKRKFLEGCKFYRKKCVIKIQSFYRGYKARKLYDIKIKKLYKSGKGNVINKRNYIQKKMTNINKKIDTAFDNTDILIDSLFADLDRNIKASRMIFNNESINYYI